MSKDKKVRASKEMAERAHQAFSRLCNYRDDVEPGLVLRDQTIVLDFINAAKRKLPTEAAYERDRKRGLSKRAKGKS